MKLRFFCPKWGSEHLMWDTFLKKAIDEGYDGVEISMPMDIKERDFILNILTKFDIPFIVQHWETINSNFEMHKIEYIERLKMLVSANPLFVNSQTGKDYFTFEQNLELISVAESISNENNIQILHETHRGKFSYAAHVTKKYLEHLANLRLTLDVSHWCNVSESFLHDQKDSVHLAISRTDHIHARVGFPEGPQVPDPRTPESSEALNIHLNWWKSIVRQKKITGVQDLTITPEFGPKPYMVLQPYTVQPITNQWDVNVFMKDFLTKSLLD